MLNNSYRLLTAIASYSYTAQKKPTSSMDGIRKLLTTHPAILSARKLRSSVRREEIMRHNNEHVNIEESIMNKIYNPLHSGCFRGSYSWFVFLSSDIS